MELWGVVSNVQTTYLRIPLPTHVKRVEKLKNFIYCFRMEGSLQDRTKESRTVSVTISESKRHIEWSVLQVRLNENHQVYCLFMTQTKGL